MVSVIEPMSQSALSSVLSSAMGVSAAATGMCPDRASGLVLAGLGLLGEFGEHEVEDLHQPVFTHHDVRRLAITMHDARPVGPAESFGDSHRDPQRLVEPHVLPWDSGVSR